MDEAPVQQNQVLMVVHQVICWIENSHSGSWPTLKLILKNLVVLGACPVTVALLADW